MITCDNVFGSCRALWFQFSLWNLCPTIILESSDNAIKVGAARG